MDPRLLLDLYGEDTAQPVDLFGAEDQLPELPWQQPVTSSSTQNISQRIQELLGAKEPDKGGMATDILAGRFNTGTGPSYGDYAQGVVQSAMGKPTLGGDVGQSRVSGLMKQMESIANLERISNQGQITPYQKESLEIQREQNAINRERNNLTLGGAGGYGKPPAGYRWVADGNLEPIPGGPGTAISAELSARLGLANKFLGESESLKQEAGKGTATGPLDYLYGAAGYGDSGKIQRRIADGADALQRMLTGAGMPQSEANDYANRFRVTAMDTSETIVDKLTNLENVLRAQIQMSTRGRGTVNTPSAPTDTGNGWSIERVE